MLKSDHRKGRVVGGGGMQAIAETVRNLSIKTDLRIVEGNSTWSGPRLRDVLAAAGMDVDSIR